MQSEARRELDRARYYRDREKRLAAVHVYQECNKDKIKARAALYRENNKVKVNEARKKWANQNPIRTKRIKQAWCARKKLFDPRMTADLVQEVYEDNIKQYGTLTCVICDKPIKFGEDTLEHNVPLSRCGNHCKDNLGVAHKVCNDLKHTQTIEEYKQEVYCG
jgi:5-methylcytosine-specific restriction endonuclease McrA